MIGQLTERVQLALDTIYQRPVRGIPTFLIHPMEWRIIDRLAGLPEGSYLRDHVSTYHRMVENAGVCAIDQWIPDNPLSMGDQGYDDDTARSATTGAEEIVCDEMVIDSPEAVAEHMERFEFPRLRAAIAAFDEEARFQQILRDEAEIQQVLGPNILKTGYSFITFPFFYYWAYGYANYFMATALFPEVIEQHFALQGDLALRNNRAAARAYREGGLPPLYRLDHDMADSRGTLTNITWLDKYWFPHFARCLKPMLDTDVRMLWHCDGNLMEMVPRLLECGVKGFQGFQYEDGMDYERICRMKTRDGEDLIIVGGVSVTRTLPMGTPADVKREMQWLVDYGPKTGLFLAGTSSITPGVSWENISTMVEGLHYYRTHGRS